MTTAQEATTPNPQTKSQLTLPINDIKVGKRYRQDLGDIDSLARSISEIGLLHPVVVTPENKLIAGQRRLKAMKQLKWSEVPVTYVDINKIVRGEYDENEIRKDFTITEAVAIKRVVEPEEKRKAKERKAQAGGDVRGRKKAGTANLSGEKGDSREKVAKFTGKKHATLGKAEKVIQAAEENPEKYGHLVKEMDDTGKVDAAYKAVRIAKQREAYEATADKGANIGDLVTMAEQGKKFSVIMADPPWEYKVYSGKGKGKSAERYYDTSSIEKLEQLPVAPLAADNCTLFLWGVWPELLGAIDVIHAWGFEYKTCGFVYVKENKSGEGLFQGLGYWTRSNTEFCLLATRGSPSRLAMDVHQVIREPVGRHSEKPETARRRIEQLLAGPYLELFARKPAPGWTVWGNEVSAEPDQSASEDGQTGSGLTDEPDQS